jgi:VIT1/CCC1 family predicted Fe2+/Mn2+ transporter
MDWKDPFFVRNLVYGIEDSLISTTSVVTGLTFAGIPGPHIIITGVILVLAEAMSMSFGSILSEESFMIASKTHYTTKQLLAYSFTMFLSYLVAGALILVPYVAGLPKPYIASICIAAVCLFVTVWKTQHSVQRALLMTLLGLGILGVTIMVGRYLEKYKNENESEKENTK